VETTNMRKFRCTACQHNWNVPYGTPRPMQCPACASRTIHRAEEDRSCHHRGRRHMGMHRRMREPQMKNEGS
jgi:transposase-like protein